MQPASGGQTCQSGRNISTELPTGANYVGIKSLGVVDTGPCVSLANLMMTQKNIPDEFAENAIKVLKLGIEAMLKDGYRYDDGKQGFENHGQGSGRERSFFGSGGGGRGYYGPGGGDGKRFRRN
jgi:hypothetical protein